MCQGQRSRRREAGAKAILARSLPKGEPHPVPVAGRRRRPRGGAPAESGKILPPFACSLPVRHSEPTVEGGRVAVIDDGPEVRLRNWFERPYDDASAAARTCYSPRVVFADEVTERQRRSIGPLTYAGGHHTVYQHATFEFALSGVSRQLVWCFLHAFPFYNTEQQSQRYVRLDEARAVVPPELGGEVRALFVASVERAWAAYAELTRRLQPVTLGLLSELWRLRERQSHAFGRNLRREAEKRAIETARYVIPIASHTAMVYTVSGITLHRLRRMAAVCDAPSEGGRVAERMGAGVERVDPAFFREVGEPPLALEETPEAQLAPPGPGDP